MVNFNFQMANLAGPFLKYVPLSHSGTADELSQATATFSNSLGQSSFMKKTQEAHFYRLPFYIFKQFVHRELTQDYWPTMWEIQHDHFWQESYAAIHKVESILRVHP